LLATALNAAARDGEIDLKTAGLTGNGAEEMLNLGTAGLKDGASDLATFRKRIKSFSSVLIAGLLR
jgi:hypothetical protein